MAIRDDVLAGADWIAAALVSSGYRADFTPSSLWEIDRFLDENGANGTPKPGGLLDKDLGSRLFAIGSYVGEVVRKSAGGEWIVDDADPQAEINVQLRLPKGDVSWPVQRVMKRFRNGAEDGVAVWGMALGLNVGAASKQPRKGFFKRFFE